METLVALPRLVMNGVGKSDQSSTWYKLYNLSKTYKKDFTAADLKLMVSCVVLSTLAVPPYDRKHGAAHFELELEKDRNLRMANLLGFSLVRLHALIDPWRNSLTSHIKAPYLTTPPHNTS